jgi:hypothetical protein
VNDYLSEDDLIDLSTCLTCQGERIVPDIFGDYGLCDGCSVVPRDPFI